jgi:hypothetical protein
MGRRSRRGDPAVLRREMVKLLNGFESHLGDPVRQRVQTLVPAYNTMADLGSSLIPDGVGVSSGLGRLLAYLLMHVRTVIKGDELRVVAGIDDWARRVRELRVQHGWQIISGQAAKDMMQEGELTNDDATQISGIDTMVVNDYVLLSSDRDAHAAERWKNANRIRRKKEGAKSKILEYLRLYVGQPVTGEELRYVAKSDRTEWARRSRELRTQDGWPVVTRSSGRPDLPTGVYMLELDRQSPSHDRLIPDSVRRTVLVRDRHECTECQWKHVDWDRSDPRLLELHHVLPHVEGGENTADNLRTLCTSCHDEIHRRKSP